VEPMNEWGAVFFMGNKSWMAKKGEDSRLILRFPSKKEDVLHPRSKQLRQRKDISMGREEKPNRRRAPITYLNQGQDNETEHLTLQGRETGERPCSHTESNKDNPNRGKENPTAGLALERNFKSPDDNRLKRKEEQILLVHHKATKTADDKATNPGKFKKLEFKSEPGFGGGQGLRRGNNKREGSRTKKTTKAGTSRIRTRPRASNNLPKNTKDSEKLHLERKQATADGRKRRRPNERTIGKK